MASNLKYSTALDDARLDQITAAIGSAGLLRIYDGTQPASPDTAVTSQVKLAELTCGTPFAPSSSAMVLTANSITNGTGLAASTATWFRIVTSGGTACVDGSAGASATDLILSPSSTVSVGATVSVTSLTITAGN